MDLVTKSGRRDAIRAWYRARLFLEYIVAIKYYTQDEREHLEDFGRPAEYDLVRCAGCGELFEIEETLECQTCKGIICQDCKFDHQCGD